MSRARTYCCVPGCRSTTIKNPGVTFSPFPINEDLKKQWISIISKNAPESLNAYKRSPWSKPLVKKPLGAKHHLVCGFHFNPSGKRNKVDKIPIFFDGKCVVETIPDPEVHVQSTNPELSAETAIQSTTHKIEIQSSNPLDAKDHDYFNHYVPQTGVCREVTALRTEIYQLNEKIAKLTTQVEFQCQRILDLKEEKRDLKAEHQFRLQSIALDNKKLEFYTGFKSKEEFDGFYHSLGPDVDNIRVYNTAKKYTRKTSRNKLNPNGRPSTLDFKNQLFLFLCRVKAGLLEEDLAYRFGVSVSSVSNIWKTWLEFLYEKLPQIMSWPTKEILDSSIPKSFLTGSATMITNQLAENIIRHKSNKSTNLQSSVDSTFKPPPPPKKIPRLEENRSKSPPVLQNPRLDLSPGIFSEEEIPPHCDYGRNNPQTSNYSIWQPYNSYDYGSFYQASSLPQNSGATSQLPLDKDATSELNDKGSTSRLIREDVTSQNVEDDNRDSSQSSDSNENRSNSSEINANVNVEKFGGVVNRYKIFKYIFPNSMFSTLSRAWRVSAYLENLTHAAKPIRKDLVEKREAKERLKLALERTEVDKEPEETVLS